MNLRKLADRPVKNSAHSGLGGTRHPLSVRKVQREDLAPPNRKIDTLKSQRQTHACQVSQQHTFTLGRILDALQE